MKAERLKREFADRGVGHDDRGPLLRPPDALELVNRAADEGVPIVDVAGFRDRETSLGSSAEQLADFSPRVAEGHGCWEEAEAVIRTRGAPGMVFGLTLGDDPIEVV